jgi:UDP-glucuronate 4-epimerase
MRILITGHLGFVGSNMIDELLLVGFNVEGYDILNGDDIRDKYQLDRVFNIGNYDLVIHLAARAGVLAGEEFTDEYVTTNVVGTKNIIDACKKYDVKNIIYFSSSSVLGGNDVSDEVGLNESAPYNPIGVYGITKMSSEFLIKQSGLNYSIIRPFTIYGERNGRKDMVIYKWLEQYKADKPITFYGDGETKRGYVYVEDLVQAVVNLCLLMREDKSFSPIYHLGGSETITLKELFELFKKAIAPKKIKIVNRQLPSYDIPVSFANTSLAERELNFTPTNKFKIIVRAMIKKGLK